MNPALTLLTTLLLAPLAALPAAEEITNSIGMKLVSIQPGTFTMGQDGPHADYQTVKHADKSDDADWDERPAHRVTLTTPLHMAVTETTVGQYRQFKPKAKATGTDDEAVTNVDWNDAVAFCKWLSAKEGKTYRLPTEAEWEYACRAGTTTVFNTGERLPDGFQKFKMNDKVIKRFFTKAGKFPSDYRDWPKESPLRVQQTPANAWGLFDMHGNVEEWCLDWYGPYEVAEAVDPVGRVDGDFRVTRGGSHSIFNRLLRSANRSGRLAATANDMIGFRVVLADLPKTAPLPMPAPALNARNVSQSIPAKADPMTKPFFSGPKPFVKVPPNMAGPLFSNHNHSPAIAECPNGDLLTVWFSCGDEGGPELAVVASRLRRGAAEWEEASPFWDGPDINDHAPKLWFDGERTLFFFAKGLSGDVMRTSIDSGATWSKGHVFQPEAEIGNMPIRTREGFMVLPLDGNKPGASLNISRDGGKTWTFTPGHGKPDWHAGGSGTRFPGIHNAIVELADGRIMALGRFDLPAEQAKFNFRTPLSYSSDLGKTWTYEASPFPAIGSVQRAVLMRLHEGPLLFCSFTDEQRYWPKRKGMTFKAADGSEFTGCGLFAAVSFDEGKTWPVQKLVTPGGPERTLPSVDNREFTLSDTMAEAAGYLSACQTRDDLIQLISSKNHYVFNLAWLKTLPAAPAASATPAATPRPPASAARASSLPVTPRLITRPGAEFSHAARKWQGIPSIEVSPGGRLWATWYGGPAGEGEPGNHQLLVTSGDDGRTWSDPVAVFKPEPVDKSRCGDGHLWLDPQGRLWWIVNRFLSGDPSPLGLRTSWAFLNSCPDDAQPHWSAPILLGPGLGLNKPTILSTGEWLNPIDIFSADRKATDPRFIKGPKVYVSTDQGASWAFRAALDMPDVTFAEHMITERKDGSLWLLARTSYGIAQSTSTDHGQTWSRGEPFTREMNVNTRFFLRRLKSGRTLLVVNNDPKARKQLTAMLSDDDGRTFPHKLLLDERKTSYPDGTESADGSLYLIYDQERYTRGAQQILFAKITEADILAGHLVAPASRLAQKINRLADYGGGIDDQWGADEKIRAAARTAKRGAKADSASPVRDTPEKLEESLKKP